MENLICSCFGHRDHFTNFKVLNSILEDLILRQKITTFMTGGMGAFDNSFSSAINKLKEKYPNIKLILVKPYFSSELNTNKLFYESTYDNIIIPDILFNVHPKSAISKRNKWMIDNSDIIVLNVYRNFGGAYDAFKYAKRQNKKIINLTEY